MLSLQRPAGGRRPGADDSALKWTRPSIPAGETNGEKPATERRFATGVLVAFLLAVAILQATRCSRRREQLAFTRTPGRRRSGNARYREDGPPGGPSPVLLAVGYLPR